MIIVRLGYDLNTAIRQGVGYLLPEEKSRDVDIIDRREKVLFGKTINAPLG